MIYFTAHTINCVCHSIRTMFRVLGMYNFGYGRKVQHKKLQQDIFCFNVIVQRTCFVETGKILYEMILLSRHLSLQRMSVLGMNFQVPQKYPAQYLLRLKAYLDLHKLDDSLVVKVTGVKINSLSQHLAHSLEFADYNLVAFSKNRQSCVLCGNALFIMIFRKRVYSR